MIEYFKWLIIVSVVLSITVGLWFFMTYWLTPHLKNPDGKARITGRCGDTMELYLKFRKDRVVESAHWTDGCIYSLNCVSSAAELAKGKSPDEILEIDADLIQKTVGGLPRDQIHCAQLAAETLQFAVEDYMLKSRTKPTSRTAQGPKGKSRQPAFENGDRDAVQLTNAGAITKVSLRGVPRFARGRSNLSKSPHTPLFSPDWCPLYFER